MSLGRYDRYGVTIQTSNYGGFTLGLPFVDVNYTGKFVKHIVQPEEEGRADLIAFKYPMLSDPQFEFFIIQINGLYDPIADIYPGRELKIPTSPINLSNDVIPRTYLGAS